MRTTRRLMAGVSAVALGLTMFGAQASLAKGPPLPGTETSNNLSVPAVFVPSLGMTLNFPCGDPVTPASVLTNSTTYFPGLPVSANLPNGVEAGNYYVQGEDKWQAGCTTAAAGTVTVTGEWGDNLTGAPLKARTPIRVEMGLLGATMPTMDLTGFAVVKLTDELDRYATYGTLGTAVTPYSEVRVWDGAAHLAIKSQDGLTTVFEGAATAEINATGRVVYGYNWQKPAAGTYTITFTAPSVAITSVDAGTLVDSHTVSLDVTVKPKAGGGGGGIGGGGGQGGGGGVGDACEATP